VRQALNPARRVDTSASMASPDPRSSTSSPGWRSARISTRDASPTARNQLAHTSSESRGLKGCGIRVPGVGECRQAVLQPPHPDPAPWSLGR
jgi:hypothetical protein